jgi:hypothetical protein
MTQVRHLWENISNILIWVRVPVPGRIYLHLEENEDIYSSIYQMELSLIDSLIGLTAATPCCACYLLWSLCGPASLLWLHGCTFCIDSGVYVHPLHALCRTRYKLLSLSNITAREKFLSLSNCTSRILLSLSNYTARIVNLVNLLFNVQIFKLFTKRTRLFSNSLNLLETDGSQQFTRYWPN